MHQLYFTFARSQEQAEMAEAILENEGFANQGYWGGPSDWFELGGRWRDLIPAVIKYGCSVPEYVDKTYPSLEHGSKAWHLKVTEIKDELFADPYDQEPINHTYELTQEMAIYLAKKYPDVWTFDLDNYEEIEIAQLPGIKEINPELWIVPIDYHI